MNYFLTLILMFFSFLSFSQKMIYNAESFSMAAIVNEKVNGWTKPEKVDIVVILSIDSSGVEVDRKISVYSNEYREFILGEFEYSSDDKGNYSIVFDAYVELDDIECKITMLSFKKKSYLIIEYDKYVVKYLLNDRYFISNMPKSEM